MFSKVEGKKKKIYWKRKKNRSFPAVALYVYASVWIEWLLFYSYWIFFPLTRAFFPQINSSSKKTDMHFCIYWFNVLFTTNSIYSIINDAFEVYWLWLQLININISFFFCRQTQFIFFFFLMKSNFWNHFTIKIFLSAIFVVVVYASVADISTNFFRNFLRTLYCSSILKWLRMMCRRFGRHFHRFPLTKFVRKKISDV